MYCASTSLCVFISRCACLFAVWICSKTLIMCLAKITRSWQAPQRKENNKQLQEADEEPLFLLMTSAGDHLFPASSKWYRKIGMISVLTCASVMELCAELHSTLWRGPEAPDFFFRRWHPCQLFFHSWTLSEPQAAVGLKQVELFCCWKLRKGLEKYHKYHHQKMKL